MSIINDALKKVQQNLERHKKTAMPPTPGPAATSKEKFPHLFRVIILGSFLGSLAVLWIIFVFAPKQKNAFPPKDQAASALQAQTTTPPLAPAVPRASKPSEPSAPKPTKNRVAGLTLNGIIRMDDGYVALINNKIARQGDAIDEKKILSISEKEVKVFDNGETVTLRLGQF